MAYGSSTRSSKSDTFTPRSKQTLSSIKNEAKFLGPKKLDLKNATLPLNDIVEKLFL